MEDTTPFSLLLTPATELPAPLAALSLGWALLTGLTVGSFLNVVIARLPEGESVVKPRSRCPRCRTQIAWFDNVPVLSWLILRAKCRHCGFPISARYPFVELLIGALGVGLAARYGLSLAALEMFLFATLLVALAFIDIDTWTVPFELLWLVLGLGVVMGGLGAAGLTSTATPVWLEPALSQTGLEGLVERGIGLVAGFLSLAAVNVIFTFLLRVRGTLAGDEWAMGWGDPLLLGAMGAVLGWRALPLIIFLASLQGSIVGIALRLLDRMPGGRAGEGDEARATAGEQVPAGVPSSVVDAARIADAAAVGDAGAAGDSAAGDDADDEDDWTPPPTALPFVPFLALAGLEVAFFGDRLLGVISSAFGGAP